MEAADYRSLLSAGNFQVFLLQVYHCTISLAAFREDLCKAYSVLCFIDIVITTWNSLRYLVKVYFKKQWNLEKTLLQIFIAPLAMALKKFQQYIFVLLCTSFESDISITYRLQYIRQHTEFCINDFKIVLTTHDIAWAVGTVFCEAYCQNFHFCYSGMKLWQFSTSLY